MPRGVSRPTQGLEVALLTGGAATAAGLYVSNAVLQRTYVASRRFFSWLLPEAGEAAEEETRPDAQGPRQIDCLFMRFERPTVLLARERDGGGLLLYPQGIVYLKAPSMSVYVLDVTEARRASLELHAYYLFQAALSWMPNAKANADQDTVSAAWNRVTDFASECMLHMLLNDLFQVAATLSKERRLLVSNIIQKLSPVRGTLSVSTPLSPTAQALLQSLNQAQWQQLDTLLPFTDESFRGRNNRNANRFFGAAFNPSDTCWTVGYLPGTTEKVSLEGIGACTWEGRLGYYLSTKSSKR